MRTKAQSQIITTILLILIVLAAVVVVWVVVNQFIGPVEQNPAACMVVQFNVVKAIDSGTTADDVVTVTRLAGGSEDDVTGISFLADGVIISPTSVTKGTTVSNCITNCNEEGYAKMKQLETLTFNFTSADITTGQEIKIGPLIGEELVKCNPVATRRAS